MRGRIYTIVPAAGSAVRMGLGYSKAYLDITGLPLLTRTLKALLNNDHLDMVTAAVRPDEVDLCKREVIKKYRLEDQVTIIGGGDERQQTVWELLSGIPADRDIVLVHDGARPFVAGQLVNEVLSAAVKWGAAIAALPATDTVKLSEDSGETVSSTLSRKSVYLVQTPQAFHRDVLIAAHRRARKENYQVTDDSSLVEWNGHPVRIVPGDPGNIKITTLEDLEHAKWILSSREK